MSILLYIFGKPHQSPETSSPSEIKGRKKLRKLRTLSTARKSIKPDADVFDVFRAQTCLTFLPKDQPTPISERPESPSSTKPEFLPHVGSLLKISPSTLSLYSHCHSTVDSMAPARLPRRAKTPVFFVGQLESKPLYYDSAQTYAQQYSDILPTRSFTPCIEEQAINPRRRSIRKIKCQQSLRDLVKEHARPRSRPTSSSDCDTLVGSESPISPISPIKANFPQVQKLHLVDKPAPRPQVRSQNAPSDMIDELHNEIGLGICMNLLTNELATALFKQHPTEDQARTSGLQILLMIEAYETLQQHVRKELYDGYVNGREVDSHVQDIEVILERWLESLYAVYDLSQENKPSCEAIKEAEEEYDWSLRRVSEDSVRTFVTCS